MTEIYVLETKKVEPFSTSFSHLFIMNFLKQFNIFLSFSVLLSCCHNHTIGNFLGYETLPCPELERLTLPDLTERVTLLTFRAVVFKGQGHSSQHHIFFVAYKWAE